MIKFKGIFTFAAFIWLIGCGFWALLQWFADGGIAWLGLFINALALPVWMVLRWWKPLKYPGDLRESPAFVTVLAGLAITLLADTYKGEPLYLAIYNLFLMLIYLYHLSALPVSAMPAVERVFPVLRTADGGQWNSAVEAVSEARGGGFLLLFLRGTFCADSRALALRLPGLMADLRERNIRLCLASCEAEFHWQHLWAEPLDATFIQLDVDAPSNKPFLLAGGVPFLLRLLKPAAADAARPGTWLLDSEGWVLWRHVPNNYRAPGDLELIRSQLFRLDD